jgi:hypothetical protein
MSPRASKNAKSPDTIDSRLRTVAADTLRPATCTASSTPDPPSARPVRWAVMNAKPFGRAGLIRRPDGPGVS